MTPSRAPMETAFRVRCGPPPESVANLLAVIINSTDVLIAAGAGGGSGNAGGTGRGGRHNTDSPAEGGVGDPGAAGGGGFNEAGGNGVTGTGGGAGTLTTIGSGGPGGVVAGSGGQGFGGGGGGGTVGGGGGGYEGGDGGTTGYQGGQGGNSFITDFYGSVIIDTIAGEDGASNEEDGSVRITCISGGVGVALEIVDVEIMHPSCANAGDGALNIIATGGIEPYMYSINGVDYFNDPSFTDLTAGFYTVYVQDAMNVIVFTEIELVDPDELTLDLININNVTCFDGSDGLVEVQASGGGSPGEYTYLLDGEMSQNNGIYNDLSAQSYVITAEDGNGCMGEIEIEISQPEEIMTTAEIQEVACKGESNGSITLNSHGGIPDYEYSIDGVNFQMDNVFSNLSAGVYEITTRDANECEIQTNFTVGQPDGLFINLEITDAVCYGEESGSLIVIAGGGTMPYLFSIDGNNFQDEDEFTDLEAGAYYVLVVDSRGCMIGDSFVIEQPEQLELSVISNNAGCGGMGGIIEANAEGGSGIFTYTLNDTLMSDDGIFTELEPGEYVLVAEDSEECSINDTIEILLAGSDSLNLELIDVSAPLCAGDMSGSIAVIATGDSPPFIYQLDTTTSSDGIFENLVIGEHTVSVMDDSGCSQSISVTISPADTLFIIIDDIIHESCAFQRDGLIDISAIGGAGPYMYFLNDTLESIDGKFENLEAGSYLAEVVDSNGCIDSIEIVISNLGNLEFQNVMIDHIDCYGERDGRISFEIHGIFQEYTLIFAGDSILVADSVQQSYSGLAAGDYQFSVIDSNGCVRELNVEIFESEELVLQIDSVQSEINGNDGFVILEAEGGNPPYMYSLDSGMTYQSSPRFDSLSNEMYVFSVKDSLGCITQVSFVITAISEISSEWLDLVLFPNPVDGQFWLTTKEEVNLHSYRIIDAQGRVIGETEGRMTISADRPLEVSCVFLDAGTYFIQLNGERLARTMRFVVVR